MVRDPKRISVPLGSRRYDILIGSGHLPRLGRTLRRMELGTDAIVLSNRRILRHHGAGIYRTLRESGFRVRTLTVADSEQSKSLSTLSSVLRKIAEGDGPGRRPFLLAAGGGVVGDLGGVAAGLYRRGIPYVQLPTTLLAQVDSSIGGKTGVDLPEGKNLVGLIYQPKLVFVELKFLSTLSDRQFRSGLAEVAKCAVIHDHRLFSFLERVSLRELRDDDSLLGWMIAGAIQVKASWVAADETESHGLRTLLNFGHTFGHALEAAAGYTRLYTHGEAVAVGMRVATDLARRLDCLNARDAQRIEQLLDRWGWPRRVHGVDRGDLLKAMAHDKKWTTGRNRWVLPTGIGRAVVREGIPDPIVRAAIRRVMED